MNKIAIACVGDDLGLKLEYLLDSILEPLSKGLKKSKLDYYVFFWPEHAFRQEDLEYLFKDGEFSGLCVVGGGEESLSKLITVANKINTSTVFLCAGVKDEDKNGHGHEAEFGIPQSLNVCLEAMGIGMPFSALVPSSSNEEKNIAYNTGRVMGSLITRQASFNQIVTLRSLENAAKIAHSCQCDFQEVKECLSQIGWKRAKYSLPILADIKPTGQFPANFFWWAGGVMLVASELDDKLDLSEINMTGSTLGDLIKDYRKSKSFNGESKYLRKRGLISQDIIHPSIIPLSPKDDNNHETGE